MKVDKLAQINMPIKFKGKEMFLRGGKDYVVIFDLKNHTYQIEKLWWFKFKNWINTRRNRGG